MAGARRHAQQHGLAELLGQREGGAGEVVGLLRIGRLKHEEAGGARVMPVVLFVLARRHAGIIGRDEHQAAGDAGIGGGKQGVGGDIDADMLHRHQRPAAGEGDADADFERDLFVWRPLRLAAQRGEGFEDFGGGSSGIAGAEQDPGIEGGECDGFVAGEEHAISELGNHDDLNR